MGKFFLRLSLAFFIILQVHADEVRQKLESVIPIIDKYIEKSMKDWGTPGCVVGIVHGKDVLLLKPYGVRNSLNPQRQVDESTIFPLSSMTKNFMSALMQTLLQNKEISFDEFAYNYITQLETDHLKKLTILNLLTHGIGYPSFTADTLLNQGFKPDEVIRKLNIIKPDSDPGHYNYQNVFFGLTGLIAEKKLEKSLSQIFKERIFDPLGMTRSYLGVKKKKSLWQMLQFWKRDTLSTDKNQASSHDFNIHDKGKILPIPHSPMMKIFPGTSGIRSCGKDMVKWLQFHLSEGKPILNSETYTKFIQPVLDASEGIGHSQFPAERFNKLLYSMAGFVSYYGAEGKEIVFYQQPGGVTGNRSLLMFIPEMKIGFFILSNLGGMRVSHMPEGILFKFLDLLLDIKDSPDWSDRLKKEMDTKRYSRLEQLENQKIYAPQKPRPTDAYQGKYQDDLYGMVEIVMNGDSLTMILKGKKVPLKHVNGDLFSFNPRNISFAWGHSDLGTVEISKQGLWINLLSENHSSGFQKIN